MPAKLQNWIEHQRRHLSAENFSAWVAGSPRVQAYIARQEKIPAAVRALEDLERDIVKKVLGPAVEKGADLLAERAKGGVARDRTGLLRKSIGGIKAKLYMSSLTAWSAAGPRRGYGRVITAKANIKTRKVRLHRSSKKFTEAYHQEGAGDLFADPVKYAHLVIGGRVAFAAGTKMVTKKGILDVIRTGRKMLRDRFTGKFFGHSVRAATPKNFLAPAEASAGQAVTIVGDAIGSKLGTLLGAP